MNIFSVLDDTVPAFALLRRGSQVEVLTGEAAEFDRLADLPDGQEVPAVRSAAGFPGGPGARRSRSSGGC